MIQSQDDSNSSIYPFLLLVYSLLSALWSRSDDLFVQLAPFDMEEVEGGLDGNASCASQFLLSGVP